MKKLFIVGSAVLLSMSLIGCINNNVNEGNVASASTEENLTGSLFT